MASPGGLLQRGAGSWGMSRFEAAEAGARRGAGRDALHEFLVVRSRQAVRRSLEDGLLCRLAERTAPNLTRACPEHPGDRKFMALVGTWRAPLAPSHECDEKARRYHESAWPARHAFRTRSVVVFNGIPVAL
jgi:hypothetical protein